SFCLCLPFTRTLRLRPSVSCVSLCTPPPPPDIYTFPYTTLFRSLRPGHAPAVFVPAAGAALAAGRLGHVRQIRRLSVVEPHGGRSEEHTSELQSRFDLVCRLLLEKKKKKERYAHTCWQHRPALQR